MRLLLKQRAVIQGRVKQGNVRCIVEAVGSRGKGSEGWKWRQQSSGKLFWASVLEQGFGKRYEMHGGDKGWKRVGIGEQRREKNRENGKKITRKGNLHCILRTFHNEMLENFMDYRIVKISYV